MNVPSSSLPLVTRRMGLGPLWIAVIGIGALVIGVRWQTAPPGAPAVVVGDPSAPVAPESDGWAGFAVQPERPAPGFTLTDGAGRPWSLDGARGSVVALFFGYTRCPDVCPQTMSRLQAAVAELGADGDAMRVVLVTTDPEHDTPETIARYVGGYDPRFVGLTGTVDEIRAVAALYGALPGAADGHDDTAAHDDGQGVVGAHDAGAAHEDTVAHDGAQPMDPTLHSSRVWLIDGAGQLRVSYVGTFTPADVAHDASILIGERR